MDRRRFSLTFCVFSLVIRNMKDLSEYREEIDRLLEERVKSMGSLKNLYGAMIYHIKTGGKRWRAILPILIAEAYGHDKEDVISLALSVELLHNFSLVHDDIEDGDVVRRGHPTIWVKFGLGHGVNVGDGMREVAFLILSEGRKKWGDKIFGDLVKLACECLLKMAEGQTMDMDFRRRSKISMREYMEMVRKKTGYVIKFATVGAAMIVGVSREVINALERYSLLIGPGFQIMDDELDFTKGKGRGEVGCDVKEGKRSILVIFTLNKASKEERKKLLKILDKPREETSKEDIDWVYNLFKTVSYTHLTLPTKA